MKKILLTIIIFISAFTIAYSQCEPPLSVSIASTNFSVCEGADLTIQAAVTLSSNPATGIYQYTWYKGSYSVATIVAGPSTTYSDLVLTRAITNEAGTYVLRVEDYTAPGSNASCYKEASTAVTVNPKPQITSVSSGITCSGVAQNYLITSNIAASYSWTRATVAGISNAYASVVLSNSITETLTNTTSEAIVVRYFITPTSIAGSCVGSTFNYDVTVIPKPNISSSATGTICSGLEQNYLISSMYASSYVWTRASVPNISPAISSSGTTSSIIETLTNTTSPSIPVIVRYTITPTSIAGGCVGAPFNYDVTVGSTLTPSVTIGANTGLSICNGTPGVR